MAREPSGHRDHVLLGDPTLEKALRIRLLEPAHAAVGGEVRVEHDEGGVALGELDERLPVRLDDVLPRARRARPRPALRLRLERGRRQLVLERRHGLELDRPQPGKQLVARPLEALVVGRARVPAVRAAALLGAPRGAP